MKTLKVGLCGVGNVGGAVLKTLINSSQLLEVQGGVHFDLVQVGARRGTVSYTHLRAHET